MISISFLVKLAAMNLIVKLGSKYVLIIVKTSISITITVAQKYVIHCTVRAS